MNYKKVSGFMKVVKAVLAVALLTCGCLIISGCEHKHSYEPQVTAQATCTDAGEVTYTCADCGDFYTEVLPAVGHDMSSYDMERTDINGHYFKCSLCGAPGAAAAQEHTWVDVVNKEPSCTEQGSTDRTCQHCNYHYVQTTTKTHSYVANPDSYVESTCTQYGSHTETCASCGDVKTVVNDVSGYAEHDVREYPKKEMSETEPGNIRYWKCQVCGKYFNGYDCETELSEEEIFTYPSNNNIVDSIEKLMEIAGNLESGVLSERYYQITATVDGYDGDANVFLISDDTEAIYARFIDRENVYTINDNDVITLKGKLCRVDDEVTLLECEVISIECDDDEIHSLFITINDYSNQDLYAYVDAHDESLDEWYLPNTNNYNCLLTGSTLTFTNYTATAVLQKVIVNGKSYSMPNGKLTITVGNEDIRAEFVFDNDNYCSVTLYELDTSNNNGNAIIADEYISYTYIGQYNDLGRIYFNSHLTFNAENANITGINITYNLEWLNRDNNDKALQNAINVIEEDGAKVSFEQGDTNKNGKVKIEIPLYLACTVLEYFTDVGQAQVTEITILYQTNNSYSKY